MKYIGSGLWAIAGAYIWVNGDSFDASVFTSIAVIIALFGSSKSIVSVSNIINHKDDE